MGIDVFKAGKTFEELTKVVKDFVYVGKHAVPLVGLLYDVGKGAWTYLVGRKNETPRERVDVAVAVQVSMHISESVKAFLEKSSIDANLVLVTNSKDPNELVPLDDFNPEEWRDIVCNFNRTLDRLERAAEAKTFHMFLAAPSALTIALGTALSKHRHAYIYNWLPERRTYTRVAVLPQDLSTKPHGIV